MKTFLLTLLVGCSIFTSAQSGRIDGKVTDEAGLPLEFFNVVLHQAADSAIVKAAVTDADGKFEIEPVEDGQYIVQFAFIGFDAIFSDPFQIAEGNRVHHFDNQKMKASASELNAVEVVFKKPLIEVKADKTVFNVENTINSTGLNALELLRKAPGVMVDNNNNISVKGRNGIIVYIDGKLSPLSGDALTAYLKSLQSGSIESIEIITNPSSKYDAAGSAGIINIRLKKNKNMGTNGNVQLGYGVQIYSKYNSGFSINRRTEKWNLYANYGNFIGDSWGWMNLDRTQSEQRFNQKTYNVTSNQSHNFKTGADYYLTDKKTIGVMLTGNVDENIWRNYSTTNIGASGSDSYSKVLDALNTNTGDNKNLNANINYHFQDTSGTDFTFDVDHGQYMNRSHSFQPNTYSFPGQDILPVHINYKNNTPVNIAITSVKSDYERVLWKGKLGTGFKVCYVTTDNTYNFYQAFDTYDVLDSTRSNKFTYTENINAAYLNYSRQWKKISMQSGLRAEQTNSHGKLNSFTTLSNETTRDVKRTYLNLFPSGGLTYNINDTNQLALTYSRRIYRPSYQDLNPFEFKMDELSYMRGNPFLQPQYTNVFEFTHTYMYMMNTSLTYSHTKDFFTEVTDTTNVTASYITKKNLGSQDWMGINISAPIPVKKWWNLFINLNTGTLHNRANFSDGRSIDVRVWSYSFFGQSTFTLPKSINLEISGWYSGPSIWGGTFVNKAMGSMDMAVKKDLWSGKASLRVALGDIFYTSKWRSYSNFSGVSMHGRGGWESRQLRVSFSYNFGNQQMKVKERKGGDEDLRQRVK